MKNAGEVMCRLLAKLVLVASCCVVLAPSKQVVAQDWVKSMFSESSHDFGNVARGSKTSYSFVFENKFEEDVHIREVRTSCKCTIPSIKNKDKGGDTLKTYGKGEIVCDFNTQAFIGARSAVVTVVFDKPYYGEMQLNVKGNIRSDVQTDPGEIQFGEVQRGTEKKTSVKVTYQGSYPWKITDVRSANENLRVQLKPTTNAYGKTDYEMLIRLLPTAPVGSFNDQIVLVTNESRFNLVTVPVRGSVQPPLVMAGSVELGTTGFNKTLKKRLIIKGKEPFEITDVSCEDDRFSFDIPSGERKVHLIPMTFESGEKKGAFKVEVKVTASLESDNSASTFVSGNVVDE